MRRPVSALSPQARQKQVKSLELRTLKGSLGSARRANGTLRTTRFAVPTHFVPWASHAVEPRPVGRGPSLSNK